MNNLIPRILMARREALREKLLSTVDLLRRRRASEIDASFIVDYVSLDWLEWHGGSLRLTTTGENISKQLIAILRNDPPVSSPLPR